MGQVLLLGSLGLSPAVLFSIWLLVVGVSVALVLWLRPSLAGWSAQLLSTPLRGGVTGAVVGCLLMMVCVMGGSLVHDLYSYSQVFGNRGGPVEPAVHCDRGLRSDLLTQRSVNDADSANRMVSRIGEKLKDCGPDIWAPYVSPIGFFPSCFGGYGVEPGFVGETRVPDSLWQIVNPERGVDWPDGFVRDKAGNVLVGFEGWHRPADGAICWLFVDDGVTWDATY